MRSVVFRYALTQCIANANHNILDKNALNTFLVILTAYQHERPLLSGIWAWVLQRTREQPLNRWNQVRCFLDHPSSSSAVFGITFVALDGIFEPWRIHTRWTTNKFMALLLQIHPSLESLGHLIMYADFFVCTRNAGGPLAGHPSAPRLPNDRRFSDLFTRLSTSRSADHPDLWEQVTQTRLTCFPWVRIKS